MKRKLKVLAPILLVVVMTLGLPVATTYAATSSTAKQNACEGIGLASNGTSCGDQGAQLSSVLSSVINLLSLFIGVAAVIMIIVAGAKFITAGGDASKVTSAKNTVVYALVGLVVVAFSQLIVRFVLTTVT